MKLILLRGLPGSGKSTLAKYFKDMFATSTITVEADSFFMNSDGEYKFDPKFLEGAHNYCKEVTTNALQNKIETVIVSNTSTTEDEVKVYKDLADEYGYDFVSLVVENRHDGKNSHGVETKKLEKMRRRFSLKLK